MIRTLLHSVREYRRESFLAPLCVTLEVILEILIPFFMARLVDFGIELGRLDVTLRYGALLLVCALFSLLFGILSGWYAARASSGFAKNLRKDIFERVQSFSFANIDRFSASGLVTRLTTDVSNVQNAYQMIIRILIRAPLMMLFSLFMVSRINARLTMIFLVAIPALGGGLFLIIFKALPHFERVFQTYDHLNETVRENVSAVRVVKAYVRQEHEIDKFEHVSKSIYDQFSTAEKIVAWTAPIMQFSIYTVILVISWIAAPMILSNIMTTGELMSLMVYVMQILSSLMMISMVFVMTIIAQTSAERISEALREKPSLVSPENARMEVPDGSIRFDHVCFGYTNTAEKLVLRGIDLSIQSGETIGIIGGTGSGKSSLIQLLPRLYDVLSGSVSVGGHDVREYDLDVLRGQVAIVLQKNLLFSGSIRENLRWGNPDATDEEIKAACRLAQADSFIAELPDGYDTHVEQGGVNFSGGQRQRLCIARALLKKPKIFILDDSTSAVDTKTDAAIREAFRTELPEMTKLIIAQRISSIEDADRVIVLDNGRLSAFDTPEHLRTDNAIYREVYESQMKGAALYGQE